MMKLKSNQTRTYDGDGYKKRAACLCFRSESEEEVRAGGRGAAGRARGGCAGAKGVCVRGWGHRGGLGDVGGGLGRGGRAGV